MYGGVCDVLESVLLLIIPTTMSCTTHSIPVAATNFLIFKLVSSFQIIISWFWM